MSTVLQFGVLNFKNMNKNCNKGRNQKKKKMVMQILCSKTQLNEFTTWVKYPTLLFAKNQIPNNIVYKGQVYKLD